MKAIVYDSSYTDKVDLISIDPPKIQAADHCLVKISYAALNRRDQWIREGLYPGIKDGVVLGSDGCGEVVEGPDKWLGKAVVVNPNIGWGDNPAVQAADYQILGMPQNGTLAEYVCVPADRLVLKPDHLTSESAAAVPLAGLTAYRACFTKAEIKTGHKVLVTGIGGGVAQFALQFSLASGAAVFVTSGSDQKIESAISTGALAGFNYKADDWVKRAGAEGPFDAIIDSAGGASVNAYLKLIKPGGRIVFYGSTTGTVPGLNMARLFWSQVQLQGSTMGNDQEFMQMIQFISKKQLTPIIDHTYPKEDYLSAFDRFKAADHQGKIIIRF